MDFAKVHFKFIIFLIKNAAKYLIKNISIIYGQKIKCFNKNINWKIFFNQINKKIKIKNRIIKRKL